MGDVPIFVAHDSADVWAHPDIFHLGSDGSAAFQAAVPPDYFSATGQLWGNPLYRWDALARTGYAWWIDRMRATFELVDVVRLDHFRGFGADWGGRGRAGAGERRRGGEGPGGRALRGRARGPRRARDRGRGPGRDHARGRGAARRARPSGDGDPAVRVRERRGRARF